MSSSDNDIFSPDVYVAGVPHARFERLRREAPVSWHEEPTGPGFWAVTKYRDVLNVLRDATTFSSEAGGTQIPDLPREDIRRSPDNLAVMDPPRHARYRALIGQSFTPRVLAPLDGYIRQLVSSLLDEAIQRNSFDFVGDFAARMPMAIILRLVGVPSEDQAKLTDWVMRLLATDDDDYATSDEERSSIARNFMEYAHAIAAERRRAPREDLLSLLMVAEVDGTRLTYDEFGMFFILLLAAGTDTPRLILASGILALLEHPTQRAKLMAAPSLIAPAVEEVLRYCSPLLHFRRTATKDTEVHGQRIARGDKVVVWHVSANRDSDVFANPHTFDIERTPNDHVSFGFGPHFCIGNALARMSARIALAECVVRMPELSLDGPVERLRSNWLNGPKKMPVAVGHPR